MTCKISKTIELIELKFSGIREGVNKLAVFKVSQQSEKIEEKVLNWEFWETTTIGIVYGLVKYELVIRFLKICIQKAYTVDINNIEHMVLFSFLHLVSRITHAVAMLYLSAL